MINNFTDFSNKRRILPVSTRDHNKYGFSQWDMTLHCNVIFHWLSPYSEWSLTAVDTSCWLWQYLHRFSCMLLITIELSKELYTLVLTNYVWIVYLGQFKVVYVYLIFRNFWYWVDNNCINLWLQYSGNSRPMPWLLMTINLCVTTDSLINVFITDISDSIKVTVKSYVMDHILIW